MMLKSKKNEGKGYIGEFEGLTNQFRWESKKETQQTRPKLLVKIPE